MAFTTYIELVEYFEAMPTSVTDLKSATVGSDEEDLNLQNSRIKYPHLRVDTPTLRFLHDTDSPVTRYELKIFVLTNEPKKTNAEENQALSDMEAIARKVIQQMWQDADAGDFDIVQGDKEGDAVRRWSGDNVFGWYWTVLVDLWTDACS